MRLRLAGTGNLPQSLRVPERTGVEWLEPEKKESIEPQGGVVGGWRTFGYVVRIKESGAVDLGEVTLPYWDPVANGYQVARAVLGKVEVNADRARDRSRHPTAARSAGARSLRRLAGRPRRARRLRAAPARSRASTAACRCGLFIAAPPLLVGCSPLGAGAARRARARRATRKESPALLAQKALAEAREAEAGGDGKALAAALERALHLAGRGRDRAQVARRAGGRSPRRARGARPRRALGDARSPARSPPARRCALIRLPAIGRRTISPPGSAPSWPTSGATRRREPGPGVASRGRLAARAGRAQPRCAARRAPTSAPRSCSAREPQRSGAGSTARRSTPSRRWPTRASSTPTPATIAGSPT